MWLIIIYQSFNVAACVVLAVGGAQAAAEGPGEALGKNRRVQGRGEAAGSGGQAGELCGFK